MTKNGFNGIRENNSKNDIQLKLSEIVRVLKKRKKMLFFSVTSALAVIIIYNIFAHPVYEATAVLKKENVNEQRYERDEFQQRFALDLMDELDTELEMFETRAVLLKVIDQLNLLLEIDKIDVNGNLYELDKSVDEFKLYLQYIDPDYSVFPDIKYVHVPNALHSGKYFLAKSSFNQFQLFDLKNEKLLSQIQVLL